MEEKRYSGLRKLRKPELARLVSLFERCSRPGGTTRNQAFAESLDLVTLVDLPLGELLNPAMSGILLVWKLKYRYFHGEITEQHQLNAQGMESLVSFEGVPLRMALLAARTTGVYRIDVFVARNWQPPFLQGVSSVEEEQEASDPEA